MRARFIHGDLVIDPIYNQEQMLSVTGLAMRAGLYDSVQVREARNADHGMEVVIRMPEDGNAVAAAAGLLCLVAAVTKRPAESILSEWQQKAVQFAELAEVMKAKS